MSSPPASSLPAQPPLQLALQLSGNFSEQQLPARSAELALPLPMAPLPPMPIPLAAADSVMAVASLDASAASSSASASSQDHAAALLLLHNAMASLPLAVASSQPQPLSGDGAMSSAAASSSDHAGEIKIVLFGERRFSVGAFEAFVRGPFGYAATGKGGRRCNSNRTLTNTLQDARYLFRSATQLGADENEHACFLWLASRANIANLLTSLGQLEPSR